MIKSYFMHFTHLIKDSSKSLGITLFRKLEFLKTINTISILILQVMMLHAQKFYPVPEFDFGGVKTEWHKRPIESCFDSANAYWTPIRCSEKMNQYLAHIIHDGKVYFLLDNEGEFTKDGSTLICYDFNSGDSLWQINYKSNLKMYAIPTRDPDEYSFRYRHGFKLTEFGLELFGFGDYSLHYNGHPKIDVGYISKREISLRDGSIINHIFNINHDDKYVGNQSVAHPIFHYRGQYFHYRNNGIKKIDPIYTYSFRPQILNDTFARISLDEKFVGFTGSVAYGSVPTAGAISVNDSTYIYVSSQKLPDQPAKFRHFMWHVKYNGDYWDLKEITQKMGGSETKDWIDEVTRVGNLIRLKITSPYKSTDTIFGHQGYLFLDFDGNIVKDQRAMILEDKAVGQIISTPLIRSKDILHVVRFIEECGINFYLEKSDGSITKLGAMTCNNPSIYAFLPKFMVQDRKGDFVLTLDTRLVNIPDSSDLLLGGWPFICKIKASELQIISDISDSQSKDINISPNPSKNYIQVNTNDDVKEIRIYSTTGNKILTSVSKKIDIKNLAQGMYFVEVNYDNNLKEVLKLMKE